MENLVSIVNKLQDVFSVVGAQMINLPQIVVVGAQSSGKSSVLESLVGRSFLPRGAGVVTRRPLILQLVRRERGDPLRPALEGMPEDGDWAVFLHKNNRVYTDFDQMRLEIETETERVAGRNKFICSEPIVLKIFSKDAPDLTMIDLPGMTKVPVGDQPPDIEETTRELVLEYARNPHCIILAVVTANTDMSTSDSLKVAKEVDPEGERTLAVVTKLDLMDAGTDAMEILCGRVIPVKLGIVGVVNRSQKDIQNRKTIKEAMKDEMAFLTRKYPTIAHKHGTAYLSTVLQSLLMNHIKNCLPDLKGRLSANLNHYQNLLNSFENSEKTPKEILLSVLTNFTKSYCNTIQGTHKTLETKELCGGARISYIFHELFAKALNNLDPLNGFNRVSIMTAIRNAGGAKPSIFIPEACFELLVKMQIRKLEPPSLRCVDLVFEEMVRIIHNCGPENALTMVRYPHLQQKIIEVTHHLLHKRVPITNEVVSNMIQIHASYINTAHPDFVKETKNFNPLGTVENHLVSSESGQKPHCKSIMPGPENANESSSTIPTDCLIVEKLIIVYFNIVKKIVQDCVPKIIMHFLVNFIMEQLLSELVENIYSSENSEDLTYLLKESSNIEEKRKKTVAMCEALKKAGSIINEIKE